MQCSLCIACCVLHTKKNSLYMPLIELCFGCWFGACRHCCYLIMCCSHRHDCCYISVVYCVLPVGACGHYHCFIFVCYAMQVLQHAWVLPPLYTYIVCYALQVLPHAWVPLPFHIVCYALWVLPHAWVLLPIIRAVRCYQYYPVS